MSKIEKIKIQPIDSNNVLDKFVRALSMNNYHKNEILPQMKKMEKWEAKEYQSLYDSNVKELKEFGEILISEPYFDKVLTKYGLKVEDIKYVLKNV